MDEIRVFVNLLAVAKYEGLLPVPMQLMTTGRLILVDQDNAMLIYTESDTDERTGEVSTSEISLTIGPDQVVMVRDGDASTTMVFIAGQRVEGVYATPFGEMDMAVRAAEVTTSIHPERGNVHLKYDLFFNGTYTSTNELHLGYMMENKEEDEDETAAE